MENQTLIIAMAEKLHRQDPTKTDEYNWLTAETIINKILQAITYREEIPEQADNYHARRLAKKAARGGRGNGRGGKKYS